MKNIVVILSLLFSVTSFAEQIPFPKGPERQVTPGSLCNAPDQRRYPEQIAYCERHVDTRLKNTIIDTYDRQFGYRIGTMKRGAFKIDHLIPLCAGGSNDVTNLWPQHESVYKITDPLEPELCDKMSLGKLKQSDAVRLILQAKLNLEKAPEILAYIRSL